MNDPKKLSLWRRMHGNADIASCMQVTRVLQAYLDGQVDDVTSRRVRRHIEACRRCGLEAAAYEQIKAVVARRHSVLPDPDVLLRLEAFAGQLSDHA